MWAIEATPEQVQDEARRLLAEWDVDIESSHLAADRLAYEVLSAIAINRLSGVDAARAALYVLPLFEPERERWYA